MITTMTFFPSVQYFTIFNVCFDSESTILFAKPLKWPVHSPPPLKLHILPLLSSFRPWAIFQKVWPNWHSAVWNLTKPNENERTLQLEQSPDFCLWKGRVWAAQYWDMRCRDVCLLFDIIELNGYSVVLLKVLKNIFNFRFSCLLHRDFWKRHYY